MDSFRSIFADRHSYARRWKERTGGKVLGYFEPYFPEELAYAAGVLPVRITAGRQPNTRADKWIYASCYPVKAMTNELLSGAYDYLDGLVNVEGCQWMYNAFEVAANNVPQLFSHYLFLPDYLTAATSKTLLCSELAVLKGRLEEWTGNAITEDALDDAIEVYNENRRLLRRMYELRRADRPPIHGVEAMEAMFAAQVMDKAEMNGMLRDFVPHLEARAPGKDRIRLMLIGSETHDTYLEEMVEALGADIVVDELDNGSSYVWNEVIPQKDRLMALALRYLDKPRNPVKDNNWRRRSQHIFELAEDFNVDGVIIAKQVYCHLHGTDNYMVWKLLREREIPFLFLERDTTLPPEETSMRLEAFLNMLRPGLNRLVGWHKKQAL